MCLRYLQWHEQSTLTHHVLGAQLCVSILDRLYPLRELCKQMRILGLLSDGSYEVALVWMAAFDCALACN